MARVSWTAVGWGLLLLWAPLRAQVQTTVLPKLPPPPEVEYPDPPEEDESYTDREYSFNPLQAKKEIDAGNFYFRKGNYRAAKNRYVEATMWDQFSPEAFYKLGEASEKLEDYPSAREAWNKFLELTDDEGKAKDVREAMAKWPQDAESPQAPSPGRDTSKAAEEWLKILEERRR